MGVINIINPDTPQLIDQHEESESYMLPQHDSWLVSVSH